MVGQRLTLTILPFLASFLLGLVSPLISFLWERRIKCYARDRGFDDVLTDNYLNFARKANASVQMSTALILTAVSGAVALVFNRGISALIFGVLTVLAGALLVWLNVSDPHEHAISGIGPYHPDALYIMALNTMFTLTIYAAEIDILT